MSGWLALGADFLKVFLASGTPFRGNLLLHDGLLDDGRARLPGGRSGGFGTRRTAQPLTVASQGQHEPAERQERTGSWQKRSEDDGTILLNPVQMQHRTHH